MLIGLAACHGSTVEKKPASPAPSSTPTGIIGIGVECKNEKHAEFPCSSPKPECEPLPKIPDVGELSNRASRVAAARALMVEFEPRAPDDNETGADTRAWIDACVAPWYRWRNDALLRAETILADGWDTTSSEDRMADMIEIATAATSFAEAFVRAVDRGEPKKFARDPKLHAGFLGAHRPRAKADAEPLIAACLRMAAATPKRQDCEQLRKRLDAATRPP
jgi:hypothetical protein